MKKLLFALPFLLCLVGCPSTSFDRATFDTLAVSNSVLKTAQADYEKGTLPHNACVYNLITKGKTAQAVAATAFQAYYDAEQAKADVTQLEATLVSDLAVIPPIVADIQTLYKTPTCTTVIP